MKTLDEVIKKCQENVDLVDRGWWEEDCFLSHEYMVDALHYLKEYRETVTNCHQLKHIGEVNEMFINRLYGTWIPVDSATVNGRCSVCGYESNLYENDVYGENYCPHCGADMRGE